MLRLKLFTAQFLLGIVIFSLSQTQVNSSEIWELIDSTSFTTSIPAGDRCWVYFDNLVDSLKVVRPSEGLTDPARQAVDQAPDWLKVELADNFSRMADNHQDIYADLILSCSDPYVDEMAFPIAHIAPNTLTYPKVHPELLLENAEKVYENASYLDYVEIIDYGNSLTDPNYYSTTEYWVESGGNRMQIELPKEYYYWYIVHPRLTKELPTYFNPERGSPTDPPAGVFWRGYLFNHADPGYPLLKDRLAGCSTLWNGLRNNLDNGAVGAVPKWVQDVMVFERPTPRSTVPVKIYDMHMGSCSEHSYITAAAARAALIPAVVTVAYRDNHKWNEFYDRRWVHWEPVNTMIDSPGSYDPGWQWDFAAVFDWRGDGYVWTVTERYTPACTVTVEVRDVNGNPVDGARVVIDSEGFPGPRCSFGYTNSSGQCRFTLGDKRNFYVRVDSDIGSYPSSGKVQIISDSKAGEHYTWFCNLTGEIAQIQAKQGSPPQNPFDRYKLEFDFDVKEILYGLNPDSRDVFSQTTSPGNIEFFICDSEDFAQYISGNPFNAFQISRDIGSKDDFFVIPTDDCWYLVLSNEETAVAKEVVDVTVNLYKKSPYPGVEISTPSISSPGVALSQNYPNPFNEGTIISYELKAPVRAVLRIYDISGRPVRTLADADQKPGCYRLCWDARDNFGREVASGVYFYRLEAGDFVSAKKMLVLR